MWHTQAKGFELQFELAERSGLPIFFHSRACREDFATIVRRNRDRISGGVVHSFTGTREEAEELISMGDRATLSWVIKLGGGRNVDACVGSVLLTVLSLFLRRLHGMLIIVQRNPCAGGDRFLARMMKAQRVYIQRRRNPVARQVKSFAPPGSTCSNPSLVFYLFQVHLAPCMLLNVILPHLCAILFCLLFHSLSPFFPVNCSVPASFVRLQDFTSA